jgi:hypothetical protein
MNLSTLRRTIIIVLAIFFGVLLSLQAGQEKIIRYRIFNSGADVIIHFDQRLPKINWMEEVCLSNELAIAAGGRHFVEFDHSSGVSILKVVRVVKGKKPINLGAMIRVLERQLKIRLKFTPAPAGVSRNIARGSEPRAVFFIITQQKNLPDSGGLIL